MPPNFKKNYYFTIQTRRMYTIEQLHEDVLQEAINIKRYATAEEISRLDFKNLNPGHIEKCIFGQMTGDCDNERAVQLIELCAKRYVIDEDLKAIIDDGFEHIQRHVNGETVDNLYYKRYTRTKAMWPQKAAHSSMLEAYILLPEANNAGLIAFIKGEAESVQL